MNKKKIAILGGGNIGKAIAFGLLKSGNWNPSDIFVTKRKPEQLNDLKDKGIKTGSNNEDAIRVSDIILVLKGDSIR